MDCLQLYLEEQEILLSRASAPILTPKKIGLEPLILNIQEPGLKSPGNTYILIHRSQAELILIYLQLKMEELEFLLSGLQPNSDSEKDWAKALIINIQEPGA